MIIFYFKIVYTSVLQLKMELSTDKPTVDWNLHKSRVPLILLICQVWEISNTVHWSMLVAYTQDSLAD
jgi:hypothetical protein